MTSNTVGLALVLVPYFFIVYLLLDRKRILRLARYDSLTGLKNRDAFKDSLESLILLLPKNDSDRRKRKQINNICLLMVDLDYFKQINDKYGHDAGDISLKLTADVLKSSLRDTDILCRWGGEEFLIALPGFALDQAEQKALMINQKLATVQVTNYPQIRLSASMGLTSIDYYAGDPIEAFFESYIRQADNAMYAAKNFGRNCVVAFDTEKYHKYKKII